MELAVLTIDSHDYFDAGDASTASGTSATGLLTTIHVAKTLREIRNADAFG